METSDDDYVAEAPDDVTSPDKRPAVADVEASEPEPGVNFWQLATDEPSTQQLDEAARGGAIVMSPADLSQVIEEEEESRRRRRSAHQPTSIRTLGSSREQLATGTDSGLADEPEEGVDEKPAKDTEEGEHKPAESGASGAAASDAQMVEKIKRRKSMYLTDDMLKKEPVEPYKIDIPLRKKVNKSTKKKLWREIERRKPFITENVREHIRIYAKPPFITWGCRNCVFPYESEA